MTKPSIITRKFIYHLFTLASYFHRWVPEVTVLCYHSIGQGPWRFSVSPTEFKKHIICLSRHYQFISMTQFEDYLRGKKFTRPLLMLTFDDGYADILSVRDFLHTKSIRPSVFLIPNSTLINRKELGTRLHLLTPSQVKILIASGWTIGSHSLTHSDFSRLNANQITKEVSVSKSRLEKSLIQPIRYFAYPKGKYNKTIKDTVKKAGYTLAFSVDDRLITPHADVFNLPRIGVDASHSPAELSGMITTPAIFFRKMLKTYAPAITTL